MHPQYLIGCSGYYYPYWRNRFYPAGLAPVNWLEYYSSVFNSVELNGTFYRTPKLSDLVKYARVTTPYFKFSVKMSKYITHVLKMKAARQSITDFQSLIREGLGDKLAHFLFQLPPSVQFNEQNMEYIMESIPHHSENVVEFRHISWWNPVISRALKKAGITFCNVNFPGLASYFIQTSDLFYLRFHGDPELFKSSYSEEQLKDYYKLFPAHCDQYSIYFNNTFYEAGYKNAQQLMDLTKK